MNNSNYYIKYELLRKIREICDSNGIELFLYGETALSVYNNAELNDDITVCIDSASAVLFANKIDELNDCNIAQESLLNNSYYPNLTIRVFNPNTTEVNYKSVGLYNNNCINIEVRIIRHISPLKSLIGKVVNSVYKQVPRSRLLSCKAMNPFRILTKLYSGRGRSTKVGNTVFPLDIFRAKSSINVDEQELFLPENKSIFFSAQFGEKWLEHKIKSENSNKGIFKNDKIPWDSAKYYYSHIVGNREIIKRRNEYNKLNREFRKIKEKIDIYYSILDNIHSSISEGGNKEFDIEYEQRILLNLLKRISVFFDEHNITYYSFGGTTIGAIRHNGFIPWDDDMDIVMDIDNYKKLLSVIKELPWDDVEFNSYETNSDYIRPFAQFTYTRDTRFPKSRIFMKGAALGSGIDVFVMDYVPSNKLDEYIGYSLIYQEILTDVYINNNRIIEHLDGYSELKEYAKNNGKDAAVKYIVDKMEGYPRKECDLLVVRLWARKARVYSVEEMGSPNMHKFEDTVIPVPAKPEACLRNQYGYDWYIVPKTDLRKQHNFYFSKTTPSSAYAEAFSAAINWDEVMSTLELKKSKELERLKSKLYLDNLKKEIDCASLLCAIGFRDKIDRFIDLYAKRKYEAFEEQTARITESASLLLTDTARREMPSSFINAYMDVLIYAGKYYIASQLLEFYENEINEAISGKLKKVMDLASAYQDSNNNDMEEYLSLFSSEERNSIPDCIIARYSIMHEIEKKDEDKLRELIEVCNNYLHTFPNNYDVLRVKADIMKWLNMNEESEELRRAIIDNSTNGLDLLRLKCEE